MMELKIASRSLTDEAGKLRRLHYFLLVDELEAGSFFCAQYGVKIAEEDGDCAQIRGITTSAVRIDELMTTLVEQQVSPTVLEDVVQRDYNDTHREAAPLKAAPDAVTVDTTGLTFDESFEALLRVIRARTET